MPPTARRIANLARATDERPPRRIGLVVLREDRTLEDELRRVDAPDARASWHATRIAMDARVAAETLDAMRARLPGAAALLPGDVRVVGYACTSGAALIGPRTIARLVRSAHPRARVTDPLTAAVAACAAVGARSVDLVVPYADGVTNTVAQALEARGVAVRAIGSFREEDDAAVCALSERAVSDAVRAVAGGGSARADAVADAVFVSCTSLRTFGAIATLEAALRRPVLSSNAALLWHAQRLAGLRGPLAGPGRLFACELAPRPRRARAAMSRGRALGRLTTAGAADRSAARPGTSGPDRAPA